MEPSQEMGKEIVALLGVPAERVPIKVPELTEAMRQCNPRQRIVLRALAESDFVVKRAVERLELLYEWATSNYVRSALKRPNVAAARKRLESTAAEMLGITAASTLARIHGVVEDAIGNSDRQNALRGLGLLAQATQAIPTGGGTNVNVGVKVMVPVETRYSDLKEANVRVIDAEVVG